MDHSGKCWCALYHRNGAAGTHKPKQKLNSEKSKEVPKKNAIFVAGLEKKKYDYLTIKEKLTTKGCVYSLFNLFIPSIHSVQL